MAAVVDIVLPCYRPAPGWHKELAAFYEYIKQDYKVGFILVNDGSPPGDLAERIEELQAAGITITYISYIKNRGKGHALRTGVAASRSEYTVYTDVDFPFTNLSMKQLIGALVNGTGDVVAGYRDENYYKNDMPYYRKLLSKCFRFFLRRVLKMPVADTQCGLKGFNSTGKTRFLATRIRRYLFDFEFIYRCVKDKNMLIHTVPVELKSNIVFSSMKLKVLVQELLNLVYVLVFHRA